MNRLKVTILNATILMLILGSGCMSFLEDIDPPKSKIEGSDVFEDDLMATAAVTGIYAEMNRIGFADGRESSVTGLCGLSADELRNVPANNYALLEVEHNAILKENTNPLTLWKSLYKSIYSANAALERLTNSSGVSQQVKAQLLGEALFIRAFCNFYLVNIFGEVPLVITTDFRVNSVISRSGTDIMYGKIVEDLLQAKDLLTSEYTSVERVRPNRATVAALLARVYLYREDWQNAELLATEIIENTAMYELLPSLDAVFLKNSREAIWQFSPGAEKFNTNEGEFFIRYFNSYYALTDTLVNGFEPFDNRNTKWVASSGSIHYPYKYKQYTNPAATVTEYSMIFRVAEQYLIRAEARAKQNNLTGLNSAESDINAIRSRAGLPNTTALSQSEVMLAIEQERKVELFTEWGHRWFDLKRWSRADEVLGSQKEDFTPEDFLYPIPFQEIKNNPNLSQNPGY